MDIKVGNRVKVLNSGRTYSAWTQRALELDLENWKPGYTPKNGMIGKVIDIRLHSKTRPDGAIVATISFDSGRDVMINQKGVEVIEIIPDDMFRI